MTFPLRWRHNGHDSVSNHQPHHCLLNRLFRRRSKKTSKLRVAGLCVGTSPGTGEFPAQMACNAENISIWWRHHAFLSFEWTYICNANFQMRFSGGKRLQSGECILFISGKGFNSGMVANCLAKDCSGQMINQWEILHIAWDFLTKTIFLWRMLVWHNRNLTVTGTFIKIARAKLNSQKTKFPSLNFWLSSMYNIHL